MIDRGLTALPGNPIVERELAITGGTMEYDDFIARLRKPGHALMYIVAYRRDGEEGFLYRYSGCHAEFQSIASKLKRDEFFVEMIEDGILPSKFGTLLFNPEYVRAVDVDVTTLEIFFYFFPDGRLPMVFEDEVELKGSYDMLIIALAELQDERAQINGLALPPSDTQH